MYGFNDRGIYHWDVEKVIVPKGEEYAAFEIEKSPQSSFISGASPGLAINCPPSDKKTPNAIMA